MKVALACDHRGFEAKRRLLPVLKKMGHEVNDFGCDSPASCDYPDFAVPVARAVASGKDEIGILLDGSGIGMSVAANKVKGVRAALVWSEETAVLARQHNDANVISVGGRMHTLDEMTHFVDLFLATAFTGEERHARRIAMLADYEQTGDLPPLPAGAPAEEDRA